MIDGHYFVTPHAVECFQKRIAAMSYEDARRKIINLLATARSCKPDKHGRGLILRVRGQWNFRAVVVAGNDGSPQVVSIWKSGK